MDRRKLIDFKNTGHDHTLSIKSCNTVFSNIHLLIEFCKNMLEKNQDESNFINYKWVRESTVYQHTTPHHKE